MHAQARTADSDRFELTVAPAPDAISPARQAFAAWLDDVGVVGEDAAELAVVYSELTANAVAAARACDGEVLSSGWLDDATVVVEVTNSVATGEAEPVPDWDLDDPLRPGGRGLPIIRAYVDDLDVVAVDGHLLVQCRRHVGS